VAETLGPQGTQLHPLAAKVYVAHGFKGGHKTLAATAKYSRILAVIM